MMKQDLKKLSRSELIEVIYQLKKQEQELQAQLETLQAALQDRKLKTERVGSIAEAALAITDIFEQAQAAADAYLAEIRSRRAAVDAQCDRLLAEAKQQAEAILAEARKEAAAQPFCRREA